MSNTHIPKVLFVLLGVFGIAAIALFAYMGGRYSQPTQTATNTNVATVKNTNTAVVANTNTNTTAKIAANSNASNANLSDTPSATTTVETTAGVSWLAEPELLDDLGLLSDSYPDDQYYRIATLDDGGELIYMIRFELGSIISRFKKDSDGVYTLLANYSDTTEENLAANVTVDDDTLYPELEHPAAMTVSGLDLSLYTVGFQAYDLFVNISDELTEFGASDYGTVYSLVTAVTTTYNDGSIEGKKYILKLVDGSVAVYADTTAFLADDGSIIATFSERDSTFADRTFFQGLVVGGCGVQGGNQYPIDMTPEALVQIGETEAGEPLYTIHADGNSTLRNGYESYLLGREADDVMSYTEYVQTEPLLLWPDAVGDYIIFTDTELMPAVECGKPLLYLYPTEPTQVAVNVGANITVSEPAYNGGWNVLAQPTGTELFWEGKGWGTYPNITTGKVVATSTVEQTIRQDLTTVGLNETEIADFLEFWLPHMPNTPYVRLTWLDTKQMNQLAPLAIKPRPDTLLRVFLDFSGQVTPTTTLSPQTLTTTPRNGFTVVEWGGLLLGQ
ncbi:MAG: hypothetical protein HY565_02875 [Candidatus Kerfeldbacteria bacterium]|nr:hypothetical protein [Candidatus Kerfeldbacteria bacterium]